MRNAPRFFEVAKFSDYREPDFVSPLVICGVVLLTALVVFCLCKKMGYTKASGCGVCTSAKAARNGVADGVVEAKDAAHLDELLRSEGCVCMFHAPWCGHCATIKPDYIEAAKEHGEVLYAMCDCENAVGPEVLQKHGIEGFPTIRFYASGSVVEEYSGERTKAAIMNWAAAKANKGEKAA